MWCLYDVVLGCVDNFKGYYDMVCYFDVWLVFGLVFYCFDVLLFFVNVEYFYYYVFVLVV